MIWFDVIIVLVLLWVLAPAREQRGSMPAATASGLPAKYDRLLQTTGSVRLPAKLVSAALRRELRSAGFKITAWRLGAERRLVRTDVWDIAVYALIERR